jgi:hypothetical protein
MIAAKITHKRSTARCSVDLCADAHRTTVTRTEDFATMVIVGYESEIDRIGEEEYEKIH